MGNEEQEVADDAQPKCFSKYMKGYLKIYKRFDNKKKYRPDDARWQKKLDHKILSVCSKMRSKVARYFDRKCKGKQEKAEFMEAWFEKAPDCRKDDEDTNKNEEQEVKKPTFGSNWDVLYSATHKDGKTVVHKDTSQDTSKNEEQEVADDAQPECFSRYMNMYSRFYKFFDKNRKLRPDDAAWQKKYDHKIQTSVCSKMRSKVARSFDRKCKGKQEKAEFMEAWFEKAPDCRKDDEDTNKNEEQEVKKPTFGPNWDVLYSATHKDGKTVVHKDTSKNE